ALVAAAALYASGSAGANTAQKAAIFLGSGSDTSQNVMMRLDAAYNFAPGCDNLHSTKPNLDSHCNFKQPRGLVNPWHDTIAERYAIGSSNGINQLCGQGQGGISSVDFARSSRVPKSSDCHGLHFVEFAQDAVSWEAFPGVTGSGSTALFAGSRSLLVSDLTNIVENCSTTNWNQVGGGAGAITIYVPQAGSGTLGTFAAAVGTSSSDNLEECIPSGDPDAGNPGSHKILENENASI